MTNQVVIRCVQYKTKAHGLQSVGFDQQLYEALGAKNVVKRYRSAGAAGGKPFEEQLAAWKKRLGM